MGTVRALSRFWRTTRIVTGAPSAAPRSTDLHLPLVVCFFEGVGGDVVAELEITPERSVGTLQLDGCSDLQLRPVGGTASSVTVNVVSVSENNGLPAPRRRLPSRTPHPGALGTSRYVVGRKKTLVLSVSTGTTLVSPAAGGTGERYDVRTLLRGAGDRVGSRCP